MAVAVGTGALMSSLPLTALAQASETSAAGSLETVTITSARKRNEWVQQVPLAMEVKSGEDLKAAGIARVQDIQSSVPGLVISTKEGQGGLSIRGVGTGDIGLGTDQSVAIHIDGIYQAFGGSGLARLFDVERVEVLKGPQGTLYGRNATAGVVNVISKAPRSTFGAEGDLSYGSFNTVTTQGMVNLPLGGDFAARLAFIGASSDGRITNTFDGSKTGSYDDFWGMRGRLKGTLGVVRADFVVQYIEDKSTSGLAYLRDPLATTPAGSFTSAPYPRAPQQTRKDLNVNLTLATDVGGVTLTSLTGYGTHRGGYDVMLGAGGGGGAIEAGLNEPYNQVSQEFQASFLTENSDWVLGTYYIDSDGRDQRRGKFFDATVPGLILFQQDTQGSFAGGKAAALFGDVNYRLSPALKLNAGLRYNWEEKRATIWGVATDPATGGFDIPYPGSSGSQSYTNVSGRVGLDYFVTKSTMLYGSISKGFKSGGVVPLGIDPANALGFYKPETLIAYEVGQKTNFGGNAGFLNLSAFYYDYTDKVELFQTNLADPFTFFPRNVQKAKLTGLDASVEYRLGRQWRVDANAAWLSAEYKKFFFDEGGGTIDLSGNRLSRAPRSSYTLGVSMDNTPLADLGMLQARLEYTHRDKIFFTAFNTAAEDAVGMVNFSARLEMPGKRWSVYLAGRNLTNERYRDFSDGALAIPAAGRTVQIGVGCKL
jgi:iron complex outermembrane receptor protein